MIPKLNLLKKLKTKLSKIQVIELDKSKQYLWKIGNTEAADKLQRILSSARPNSSSKINDIVIDKEAELIQGTLVSVPLFAQYSCKEDFMSAMNSALGSYFENIQSIYADATGITIKIFIPDKK